VGGTTQTILPAAQLGGASGAQAAGRIVGFNANGAPTSGTWNVGDVVFDQRGTVWAYTASGWQGAGPGTGASKVEVALTTTAATQIATLTPEAAGEYQVLVYVRVVTAATTVTVQVSYTDASGAQTQTPIDAVSEPVGFATAQAIVASVAGQPITVTATAGTANQVFVTAGILLTSLPSTPAGLAAVLAAGSSAPSNPLSAQTLTASGLTGATAAMRLVGATASGAPTSGTFALGDVVVDQSGKLWVCTAAGTPGTWAAVGAGGGMTLIQDVLLSAVTASITFSSIPQTYKSLVLDLFGAVNTTGVVDESIHLNFNGDTGTNYDSLVNVAVTETGGLASYGYGVAFIAMGNIPAANAPAGSSGGQTLRIPNYASTTFWKSVLFYGGDHWGTSNNTAFVTYADWRSTAAISEISLQPASGSFLAGTRATLWGLS
jgi:hypothetical protein